MENNERIKELVKKANDKASWENRFDALNEIKKIDCRERIDVISRLALHDKVFKVKEEACRIAQSLKIKKGGKPIYLGKKDIGFTSKDFVKTFKRIVREKNISDFNLENLKEGLKIVNAEMYDVMLFEKKDKFDSWIENIYKSLPK